MQGDLYTKGWWVYEHIAEVEKNVQLSWVCKHLSNNLRSSADFDFLLHGIENFKLFVLVWKMQ